MYSTMQFVFLEVRCCGNQAQRLFGTCQTSKMERLAKLVNVFQPFTIFAKQSILDVRQGSEYASEANHQKQPGTLRDIPSEFKGKISAILSMTF